MSQSGSPLKLIHPIMTRGASTQSYASSAPSPKSKSSPVNLKGKSRDGRRVQPPGMKRNPSSSSTQSMGKHTPNENNRDRHRDVRQRDDPPKLLRNPSSDSHTSVQVTGKKKKHKNKSRINPDHIEDQPLMLREQSTSRYKGNSSSNIQAGNMRRVNSKASTMSSPGESQHQSSSNPIITDKKVKKSSSSNTSKQAKKSSYQKKSLWLILYETIVGRTGSIKLSNRRAREVAVALDLQPWHLRRMRRRFDEIDVDHSGNVSGDEFLHATGANRSAFTDKLFAMIDLDGSGTIEYDEFVSVIAMYCMFTKNEILRFCFDCFDVDKSGAIDEREFIYLCRAINGVAPSFPANFKKALEDFDVNEDGLIDYNEFVEIERRYPMILFPAFKLQDSMQRFSLGESTWLKILEKYNHRKKSEEYRRIHGKPLPESFMSTMITTMIAWTRPKVQVRVHDEENGLSTPKSRKKNKTDKQ